MNYCSRIEDAGPRGKLEFVVHVRKRQQKKWEEKKTPGEKIAATGSNRAEGGSLVRELSGYPVAYTAVYTPGEIPAAASNQAVMQRPRRALFSRLNNIMSRGKRVTCATAVQVVDRLDRGDRARRVRAPGVSVHRSCISRLYTFGSASACLASPIRGTPVPIISLSLGARQPPLRDDVFR